MDPNANLDEQRRIARRILRDTMTPGDITRLAELVDALDDWITNGGFLPDEWDEDSQVPKDGEE